MAAVTICSNFEAPKIKLPTLQADSLPAELQGKLKNTGMGRPSLHPGDLPDPGIDPGSPALQEDSLPTELWGKLYFWGFKITADGDCSHEIKKLKVMTKLDSILKSRDIALPKKAHLVKAMVFPVVRYGWESWTIKKAECWRIGAFELWCWRRLLRVPWTARRSIQSILKEISPEYSLEGLMLKLKLQYFGHLIQRADSLEKTLKLEKIEAGEKGDDSRWGGWTASPTQWTWVWASSGSWWWTEKSGVLQSMGSLSDWIELKWCLNLH